MLGALLGPRLPKHHLSEENKEVVRLAMALVGTLTGITLGLLIGSAKTYYDTQSNELTQMSANVALLGELLQHYGPTGRRRTLFVWHLHALLHCSDHTQPSLCSRKDRHYGQ